MAGLPCPLQQQKKKLPQRRSGLPLLSLSISRQHGFISPQFGGWLEHLFLLFEKLFVCFNNYALMFPISFLQSLEKPLSIFTSFKVVNF